MTPYRDNAPPEPSRPEAPKPPLRPWAPSWWRLLALDMHPTDDAFVAVLALTFALAAAVLGASAGAKP